METQSPIACDLSAIDDNKFDQHREHGRAVFEAINGIRQVANGYEFKLPAETEFIQQAGAFIARERLCCPFFEFTLTIPADHNPVRLKLTGREGVQSYIKETLLPRLEAPVIH